MGRVRLPGTGRGVSSHVIGVHLNMLAPYASGEAPEEEPDLLVADVRAFFGRPR
jgi:hypothetical protein